MPVGSARQECFQEPSEGLRLIFLLLTSTGHLSLALHQHLQTGLQSSRALGSWQVLAELVQPCLQHEALDSC